MQHSTLEESIHNSLIIFIVKQIQHTNKSLNCQTEDLNWCDNSVHTELITMVIILAVKLDWLNNTSARYWEYIHNNTTLAILPRKSCAIHNNTMKLSIAEKHFQTCQMPGVCLCVWSLCVCVCVCVGGHYIGSYVRLWGWVYLPHTACHWMSLQID